MKTQMSPMRALSLALWITIAAVFVAYGWMGIATPPTTPADHPTVSAKVQTVGFCILGHNSKGGCRGGSLIPGGGGASDSGDSSGSGPDSLGPAGPTCPQVVHNDGSVTCVGPTEPGTCSSDTNTCYGDPPKLECKSVYDDTCKLCDYTLDCQTVDSPYTHETPEGENPHVDPPDYDPPAENNTEPAAGAP